MRHQTGVVSGQLLGLAVFVAIVMGIGAVFGAMNTMYALVAARTRKIAPCVRSDSPRSAS